MAPQSGCSRTLWERAGSPVMPATGVRKAKLGGRETPVVAGLGMRGAGGDEGMVRGPLGDGAVLHHDCICSNAQIGYL